MNEVDIKKSGLEGKNSFLSFFNPYSYKYDKILDELGYDDLDNLVEVIRNKIYSLAEGYETINEYFFYASISGNIIISMFESIILEVYEKMVEANLKLEKSSTFQRYLYYLKKDNWLLEYEALIEYCSNFKIENIEDMVFDCFYTVINNNFKDRKEECIESFRMELPYLTKSDQSTKNFDNYLVKKLGGK